MIEIIDGNKNVVEIVNDQEIIVIQTVGLSGEVTTGDLALKEDVANKATDFSDVDDTVYPSVKTLVEGMSGAGAYYFTNDANDLGAGRLDMVTTVPAGGGVGINFSSVTNGTYLSSFCTQANIPNVTHIPSGLYIFKVQARKTAGTKTAKIYAEFYTRTVLGVNTLIGTSSLSDELTGTNITAIGVFNSNVVTGIGATDRLLVMFKADVSGSGTDPDITFDIQGATFSRLIVPFNPAAGGGGGVSDWGDIGGTLSDQTDLQAALDLKADQTDLDLKEFIQSNPDVEPNGLNATTIYSYVNPQVRALQNSPDESVIGFQRRIAIDPDSTGFDLGTNGSFGQIFDIGFNHTGTSDIGNATYFNTYSNFGNGTDPISVKGLQYWLGFGNINADVTIVDSIQGFGIQMAVDADAVMTGYFSGFYDNMDFGCSVGGYISFSASPQLAEVRNNNNVTGFNANPTIDLFTGNAGYTAFAMSGQFNMSGSTTGGVSGINLNPTISNFAAGHYYNGVYSSTQGITGAGTNKYAGYFDGDVNITGSLTFGGALSIGQLNAFASATVIDGGGNPTTIHGLVSQMNVPASATIANADTLGVNTAALIGIGANATVTSGALGIGLVGLALPAVIETHTGSTVDFIGGAAFALNFSGSSTGGTLGQGYGGMFVPIPNGITTVNRWYGMWSRSPFGSVATDNWGVYSEDCEKNYFEGAVKIGGTDTPSAGLKLHVEGDTKFDGDIGFYNTSPVAQQVSSGPQTATIVYTATEQTMIQEMYNALRAYGLLS
jgi:hypothetical protein